MILAMQEADGEERMREELAVQLQYIKDNHSNEIRKLESEAEAARRKNQNELDDMTN
jgi:hypothetical protein